MINFRIILSTFFLSISTLANPSFGSNKYWENDENVTPHRQHIQTLEAQIRQIQQKPLVQLPLIGVDFCPMTPKSEMEVKKRREKKDFPIKLPKIGKNTPSQKSILQPTKNQNTQKRKPTEEEGSKSEISTVEKYKTNVTQSQSKKSFVLDITEEERNILLNQLQSLGIDLK